MKFLVSATPGPMPPSPDQLRAAQDWLQSKVADGTFDSVFGYLEGGGFSITNADSVDELQETMMEYPLYGMVEWEVKALVELETSMPKVIAKMEEMSAQMGT